MGSMLFGACLLVFMAVITAIYVILISSVFPKFILKVRCTEKESRDRGLKKYLFPSGRGVLYAPHPSNRGYVESYALFTHEGYKYVKCRLNENVKRLGYSVIMFNNRDKVIDVIDVDEIISDGLETDSLLIHQDTSYISLRINSVNGIEINKEALFCCKIGCLGIYGAAVSALTYTQFMLLFFALDRLEGLAHGLGLISDLSAWVFVIPALLIGAIASLSLYRRSRAKGLRWLK